MPNHGSPTVRGRRLAAELRRLRERSGLTGEQVAGRLGWSGSKVSRIELHRIGVKQSDLSKLLDLYQVSDDRRSEILTLARESVGKSWLERITASLPPEDASYLHAETEAQAICYWEPQTIPGILQTADYARAILEGFQSMFSLPPADLERRLEARLLRQQLLSRAPPVELSTVVDESVLYRHFGSKDIMRHQLERLLEVTRMPNVEVRVLPLAGHHPIGTGAFLYLHFAQVHEVPLNDIVAVEHLVGNHYLDEEEDTYQFRVTFEHLMAASLGAEESQALIAETAQRYWS